MVDHKDQFKEIVDLTGRCLEQLREEGVGDIFGDVQLAGKGIGEGEMRAAGTNQGKGDAGNRPGRAPASPPAESIVESLGELRGEVARCHRCGLGEARGRTVFGEGSPRARVIFVGEAPGAEEDRTGLPFVGRAGRLLTKMLEAIGLNREDVYITNVLKCRPPGNRDPRPREVDSCEPYLLRQLELIRPVAICTLGRHAVQTLLKTSQGINKMRGKLYDYHGVTIIPTFHPAYLLRNPPDKRKAWEDLKKLKSLLD